MLVSECPVQMAYKTNLSSPDIPSNANDLVFQTISDIFVNQMLLFLLQQNSLQRWVVSFKSVGQCVHSNFWKMVFLPEICWPTD
jgi:hypothetical protein